MLLKTILLFCLFGYFHGVLSEEADMETSPTNVKEITVSIEHNSDDDNSKTNDDTKKNPHSKRTRANLLLNSKVVYPPGAKSASAFNQGILKFQQLLELPLNNTKEEMLELKSNGIEEAFNNSAEVDTESKNVTSTDDTELKNAANCGNSTLHGESESSLKILKNKFIEDFGTSGEKILNLINNNGAHEKENERNETEISDGHPKNKSEEVEIVEPVNLKPNNLTLNGTDNKKGSLEILDDDMEDASNSTDSNSSNATWTQSSYLPAERKSSDSKIVEVKPQKLQEIPLDLNLKNSARKEDREDDKDDISLNIKRDILLGNLNPFFSNPSTNSIRNTNSIFFDDMIKKSGGLIGPMNPFVINSISLSGSRPGTSNAPAFSRLQATPAKSSGSVKTLKSIALSEDSSSSSFGSKLGGHSSSFGGLSSSLGGSSSSLGGSPSSFGGHSSNVVQSSRIGGHVRGRRPNYSRFRNKPSKSSKATSVETVPSIHVGDGKKSTSFNFGASPSFNSQKSSVKTVPSLLIREEEDSPKYSSRYQNKSPSAVSSASFTFTPGASKTRTHGRTKGVSSYSKPRAYSTTSSYSKPLPSPKKHSGSEGGIEILKSVDYSLPEEVGRSLTKTGPAKFKRTAGFEATPAPNYSMQASVTVDPLMVNFDMTRKAQDNSINAYMVNTQMRPVKRNAEKSRSFEFRPSAPDSTTRQMREFNQDLQKKTFFQPSIRFQTITELPQEEEMFDLSEDASEDEKLDNIQMIGNLDGNLLFKPYFLSQIPQTFHMKPAEKNGRIPRSFDSSNYNPQLPRSFQMADPSTYRYFGNVHMIDLS